MPSNESRRARERRLRAKYRKKTAVTAIITLVIGLIVGFVLCVLAVNHEGWFSRVLKIGPVTDSVSSEVSSTPAPAVNEGSTLPFNQPDADPADLSGLGNAGADFDASGFGGFGAEGTDVLNPFAMGEGNAIQSFEAEPEGDFTSPERTTDAQTFGADPGLQITPADPSSISSVGAQEPVAQVTEEPTPEPTEEPTEEPTPEPTPEPSPEPIIVPYGQLQALQTEIKEDGSRRTEADDEPYETLDFSLKVDAYKDPAYFQEQYSTQYKLQGDEAAVQFDITLNNYTGTTEIIPQNALRVTLVGEDPDDVVDGYQLMDAEIAGKTEVTVSPDVTAVLFKRYPYSAEQGDMVYMAVTTCVDGEETVYWFEILNPEPDPTPEPEEDEDADGDEDADDEDSSDKVDSKSNSSSASTESLTIGSQGDEVKKLQQKLIELGVLSGTPDGKFGKYTAEAVKTMQGRYKMGKTGVADQEFLDRLYNRN